MTNRNPPGTNPRDVIVRLVAGWILHNPRKSTIRARDVTPHLDYATQPVGHAMQALADHPDPAEPVTFVLQNQNNKANRYRIKLTPTESGVTNSITDTTDT